MTYTYKSRNGFLLAPMWVQRTGEGACHQLDYSERQGLSDPLVVRFVAAVYSTLMAKVKQ